ncbi:MAG: PKD domain-containing protein [Bacteroidia bacterium]|nr:PKD domain-containing protein [Bacteroidia bacterium]
MSLFLGILYYYDPTAFMSSYNSYNTTSNPAYFRHFTHFMHHYTFVESVSGCPVNLYNMFTCSVDKELLFKQSWYKTFYKNFTNFSNNTLPALEDFNNTVIGNTVLKSMLDPLNNWTNIAPCIVGMYNLYENYMRVHSTEITARWAKITGRDTTILSSWDNYFIAIDTPKLSSTYILSVITPDYAEIDEITVFVDTALNTLYVTSMQWDSTAYFENYTEPQSSATTYHWNFGDGTSSTEINPIHTFPKYDSIYIVCLTATNSCNSYTFCDTVRVDSMHQGMYNKVQKPIKLFTNQNSANLQSQVTIPPDKEFIKLTNYPNPFDNSTSIDYEIWQSYSNAELRITNVLGQQIIIQKLVKPVDKINIDGSALHDGLYYYSIFIDGAIKQTKSMSVTH